MMLDSLLTIRSAAARIWVFSDLQQSIPERAERFLDIALDDMRDASLSPSAIWYLGDAVEGRDLCRITDMIQMQVAKLSALHLPLCFVMGNHDLDCTRDLPEGSAPVLPVWDAFRNVSGWKTTATYTEFYFTET